jgi:hypothetical protein
MKKRKGSCLFRRSFARGREESPGLSALIIYLEWLIYKGLLWPETDFPGFLLQSLPDLPWKDPVGSGNCN